MYSQKLPNHLTGRFPMSLKIGESAWIDPSQIYVDRQYCMWIEKTACCMPRKATQATTQIVRIALDRYLVTVFDKNHVYVPLIPDGLFDLLPLFVEEDQSV